MSRPNVRAYVRVFLLARRPIAPSDLFANPPYDAQWRIFRQRDRVAMLTLAFGLLTMVPIAVGLDRILRLDSGFTLLAVAVAWALVWAYPCFRVTRFRCPRCERPYFSHRGESLFSVRECASCGLKLYADA